MNVKKFLNPIWFKKIPFILVLISALSFRVTNLDLIEFKADEATNIFLAAQPLFGHSFSPGGTVSSLGILNPPVFNYFIFLIEIFSFDPRTISFLIAFISAISIAGLFLLFKKYYSPLIAFIATILMSFSPWSILYSRKIWMQDLLLPFTVLLLLSIHNLQDKKTRMHSFLYALSCMMLIQLHQISIVFVLITTILLLFKKIKLDWKYVLFGILVGVLPLIPYALYEVQNKFPTLIALIESHKKLNSNYSLQIFLRPLQIIGIGDFRFVLGNDTLTFAQNFPLVYKVRQFLYVEYLILPVGLLLFMRNFRNFSFLALATILTVISYFLLKIEPFMHYFIILTPLLFLFLAIPISFLIENKSKLLKIMGILIFSLLMTTSFLFDKAFFDLLSSLNRFKGDYGTAYFHQGKTINILKNGSYSEREKALANYIPLNYMFGYAPLGKVLYGRISPEDIQHFEQRLIKDPEDKLAQFALLSFYTKNKVTPSDLGALRLKASQISAYQPILNIAFQDYISSNYKKEFASATKSFFYPEHWLIKNQDGVITLTGDGYKIIIRNLENDKISFECINEANKCDAGMIESLKSSLTPIY